MTSKPIRTTAAVLTCAGPAGAAVIAATAAPAAVPPSHLSRGSVVSVTPLQEPSAAAGADRSKNPSDRRLPSDQTARWDIEESKMTTRIAEPDVEQAARRLYDAEVALHAAHQTAVDTWIAAASDALHRAVLAHRRAVARATRAA